MSAGAIQNSYPETIIPTGGSFVLDELYYGQCVQVGGARNSLLDPKYNYTNLFIKSVNDSGQIEFVKVAINVSQKIIIDVGMHNFEIDENNEVKESMFDAWFSLLDIDEPYLGSDNTKRDPVLITSLQYSNGQFIADRTQQVLTNLSQIGFYPSQIEIVDKPRPKIQPHLLQWDLVR